MRTFDVTYESVDLEVVPARLLGDWPASSIRLQLSGFAPAAIMVATALLYYFVLVPVVFPATKPQGDRAVARCKRSRSAHNLALFLYSGACCFGTAAWLFHKGELFSWHALMCTPVEGTWLRALSATFTLSKLVEWIDTAFLVWLGRSPPQFLHKYHHATTFWLFCFVMNLPGPEKFGLLMNGGVHTMMCKDVAKSGSSGKKDIAKRPHGTPLASAIVLCPPPPVDPRSACMGRLTRSRSLWSPSLPRRLALLEALAQGAGARHHGAADCAARGRHLRVDRVAWRVPGRAVGQGARGARPGVPHPIRDGARIPLAFRRVLREALHPPKAKGRQGQALSTVPASGVGDRRVSKQLQPHAPSAPEVSPWRALIPHTAQTRLRPDPHQGCQGFICKCVPLRGRCPSAVQSNKVRELLRR